MTMIGGDLLACWTMALVSPRDDVLSPQLTRSGPTDALDDSHRPPVVIMVDELRASFRDDGRRINASGELRRQDDGEDGGRWDGGWSACSSARADADRARPLADLCCGCCWAADCGIASASRATASTGRAVACSGM